MLKTELHGNKKLIFKSYHSVSVKEAIHWEKTLANHISDKWLVLQGILKHSEIQ